MDTQKGKLFPFGPVSIDDGFNFSIYAKNVDNVLLCFFYEYEVLPFEKIQMNKFANIWHVFVKGLPHTFVYNYEIKRDEKTLSCLDPYAKMVASDPQWHNESRRDFNYKPLGKNSSHIFDWENDIQLNIPKQDLIIYEMHVRGFTCHPTSKVSKPGTFKGMLEKIPYLVDLGVNAVELMPIQEFCEEDVISINPNTNKKMHNYFGYSSINFFSLMNRYASESSEAKAVVEFKTLVKELHKNGIEVILDVVFNHTQEGNEKGPILSFKALDQQAYYMLRDNQHMNFSGCGNTLNCNHPITMEMIIQSLRYWVAEFHIDGFRFDLAAIFNRGPDGSVFDKTAILEGISMDPILASIKMIAEPWDAGGLYVLDKIASYGTRWSSWNDKFQQNVRNFIKGTHNQKGLFASALTGSRELFQNPFNSINYIVCHDGFCLADLVSYNEKHNIENGENNNDGNNQNFSWNCGFEGETKSKRIINLRQRQMRNFHLALMLSQGIPMFLMGDEYGHTRQGNNNPWNQDNEINWFLWDKFEKNKEIYNFVKFLIHFRKSHPLLKKESHFNENDIKWHGVTPNAPEWEKDNKLVAFTIHFPTGESSLFAAFNASHHYQDLTVPSPSDNKTWQWVVNTKENPPNDFYDENRKIPLHGNIYHIAPYSSILLKSY